MKHLFIFLVFLGVANLAHAVQVQSISGIDTVWNGYLESHITYCNKRNPNELLTITYKSPQAGEARLVDSMNRPLWQKPGVESNQDITIQVPWNQICWSMGNRKCKNPQQHPFKVGINSNSDSSLEDSQVIYVQITDRCTPSQKD